MYKTLDNFQRWGVQNHTFDRWVVICGEELGEIAKCALTNDVDNYRKELIDLAAAVFSALYELDYSKTESE